MNMTTKIKIDELNEIVEKFRKLTIEHYSILDKYLDNPDCNEDFNFINFQDDNYCYSILECEHFRNELVKFFDNTVRVRKEIIIQY